MIVKKEMSKMEKAKVFFWDDVTHLKTK